MIKANELRIGNYMNFYSDRLDSNFEWKVTEHTIFNIAQGITLENGLDEFSISPIPLTEEWLLRFGFEKMDETWYTHDHYNLELDERGFWLSFQTLQLSEIFYFVHQLQNIHFALTGQELKHKQDDTSE